MPLLASSLILSAQTYTHYVTNSGTVYQRLSGKGYTKVDRALDVVLTWDIAPEGKIYRESIAGVEEWVVNKEAVVNGIKRYYLDALLSDPEDNWVSIEGDYVVLYENAGQTKRTFPITKRQKKQVGKD